MKGRRIVKPGHNPGPALWRWGLRPAQYGFGWVRRGVSVGGFGPPGCWFVLAWIRSICCRGLLPCFFPGPLLYRHGFLQILDYIDGNLPG